MLQLSDWIALLSLVFSVITAIVTEIQRRKQNQLNDKQNAVNNKLKKDIANKSNELERAKIKIEELNNRQAVTPYFNLILDDNNITYKNKHIYLKIGLINVGTSTAVQMNIPRFDNIDENDPMDNGMYHFMGTSSWYGNFHLISEYLSDIYALPEKSVYFKICANREKLNENSAYVDPHPGIYDEEIEFKLEYTDVMNRLYEQHFKFLYSVRIKDNELLFKNFSLNKSVSAPKLLNLNDN